jgi:hypothetical protein
MLLLHPPCVDKVVRQWVNGNMAVELSEVQVDERRRNGRTASLHSSSTIQQINRNPMCTPDSNLRVGTHRLACLSSPTLQICLQNPGADFYSVRIDAPVDVFLLEGWSLGYTSLSEVQVDERRRNGRTASFRSVSKTPVLTSIEDRQMYRTKRGW